MKITLKIKFLLGFFMIFLSAFFILNYSVGRMIENNNINTITQELKVLKKNCNVYIRQALLINQMNADEKFYESIAEEVIDELEGITESEAAAYSLDGKLIYSSKDEIFNNMKKEDLNNALEGLTSYTISKDKKSTKVYFSYPVTIVGKKIGIIRLVKDYSAAYTQAAYIEKVIMYITIVIFLLAYIFSYILSRKVTVPITKLTKASKEVSEGNLMVQIEVNSKDEIGDLSVNFNKMVKKIDKQINTIEKDRDNLKALNNHRKNFYDNVTHELKTPLTSILGYAEMIKSNGFSDLEFFNKGVNHIINESKRLHNMVLNLLEISKETSQIEEEFTEINLSELLANTCEIMSIKAQRYNDTIKCSIKEKLYVYGKGNSLKQVFTNLIDNAIKYGDVNSKIEIEACKYDKYIEIKVKNQGKGIKKEDIDKIFTPFYRADKKKSRELGSCGLGLSIVKSIVEDHKGEINIESVINEETVVTVKLPIYRGI